MMTLLCPPFAITSCDACFIISVEGQGKLRGKMKLQAAILGLLASSCAAFSPTLQTQRRSASRPSSSSFSSPRTSTSSALNQYAQTMGGAINLADEYAPRDVYGMEQWAQQYGLQKADGVELYSEDGADYQLVAQNGVGAGQMILYVPSDIILSSNKVAEEFGGAISQAEQVLVQMDHGTQARLPLFRLMAKILNEYDQGENSPFFPWLSSLPRQYYNGVSMTDACFSCLPPYAGWLTSNERNNYHFFVAALRKGYVQLESVHDEKAVMWAYNVAFTRFEEVWSPSRQKLIAPMADMVNHSAEPNCEISFDDMGNCQVTALYDIPPGTPITKSYGDPTNP